jgi:hypothetical protein
VKRPHGVFVDGARTKIRVYVLYQNPTQGNRAEKFGEPELRSQTRLAFPWNRYDWYPPPLLGRGATPIFGTRTVPRF